MRVSVFYTLLLVFSCLCALSRAATSACDIGSFRSGMACVPCPKGTYQDKKGATECIPCPKGFFNNLQGAPGVDRCMPCPIKTFSIVLGAVSSTVCKPCPPGTTAPEGANRCLSCPAGSFVSKCPQGAETIFYPDLMCRQCVARCTFTPPALKCRQCGHAHFSAKPNSLTCEPCPLNTFFEVGSSSCKTCPPGQGIHYDDGICKPCKSLLFQDGNSAFCDSCPSGMRGNKRRGATACVPCPEGTAGTFGKCKQCEPGENTRVTGATFCEPDNSPCPSNFFRNSQGFCQRCKMFERYNLTKQRCDPCPKNSVSKGGFDTVCKRCGRDEESIVLFGLNNMNSREAACMCKDGFARTPEGPCVKCAPGFFRGHYFYGDFSQGQSCVKCFPGSIAKRAGTAKCEQCPPGTLQPLRGQTTCLRCPPGTISNDISSECIEPITGCPKGTTRINSVRSSFYCKGPMPSNEPPCSVFERFVVRTGRCVRCTYNFISNGGRDRTCKECNGIIWADYKCKCISDVSTARELVDGICRTCRPGTFGITGVEGCAASCRAGTFREQTANPNYCELCPPGTFSGPGEGKCRPCPDGTDSFGFGYANCVVPGSLA